MRAVISTLLMLIVVAASGCLDEETGTDSQDGTTDPTQDMADPGSERRAAFLADHPTFCDEEATCDFWDDEYHQYVVYNLDTTVIDVVIVPPAGGSTPDNIAASRLAVQAWSDGIEAQGAAWFADNFTMNVYAVGIDIPSLDAIEDPEIVVLSTSAQKLVGIGLEPKQFGCQILNQGVVADLGGHEHNGNQIFAQDCTGIGFTCFAINVGDLNGIALQDLIAHEVGHCLGGGHVGDALDFRARYAPIEDIMSYQDDPTHVHCVSNFDVRVLEGVYAHLLDRPEEEWLPRGSFLPMDPLEYDAGECDNPPGV